MANLWRSGSLPAIEVGVTTQSQILEMPGPPSQLIGLEDQVVLYYLRERTHGQIRVFVLYNRQDEDITYDRAIFFFDRNGILVDHAFSDEEVPLE